MRKYALLWQKAIESAQETRAGCTWVFTELVSEYAKRQIAIALALLFLATISMMGIPYVMKYVIDAHAANDTDTATTILLALGVATLLQTLCGTAHDFFRERAWNRNYLTVHTRLVEKMYGRTLDEIVAENSEVGAEQIESLKDQVRNILYLLLFESPIVLATILTATAFLFATDVWAGTVVFALTLFNLLWFFLVNASLDEKMEPIDHAFRRNTRRIIERLNLVTSVKAAGVEEKMVHEIEAELSGPLADDFQIWGVWFLCIDTIRRCINALTPICILLYGVTNNTWSQGTLAAASALAFAVSREYGFIGHLMRHLASQVARIKATRQSLSKVPLFTHDTGIVYQRSS